MKISLQIRLLNMILLITVAPLTAQQQNLVVGYYPAWNRSAFPPAELQMSTLTHVIHAFAWPDSTGAIQGYSNVPDAGLIATVHNAGKKILLALGGYGNSGGFVKVATNPQVRASFVERLGYFISENGYDGADIDWEWPDTSAAQREGLVALVREIRSTFDTYDSSYTITMAVPVTDYSGKSLDFAALLSYVNWFNAMTYDFHGTWTSHAGHNAPLYAPPGDSDGSVHEGIQYLSVTRGIPKARLVLGLPFFGKQFNATGLYAPRIGGGEEMTYSQGVYPAIQSGWTYHWDDVSKVPYLTNSSGDELITYDDSTSLSIKCQYAKDNKLSGVMIWALGEDLTPQGQPLMEAVGKAMFAPSAVVEVQGGRNARDFVLFGNYPNPFNPATNIRFDLLRRGRVMLKVYNLLGQEVATLVDEPVNAGTHEVSFDASQLSSGVYIYTLQSVKSVVTRKMILIK